MHETNCPLAGPLEIRYPCGMAEAHQDLFVSSDDEVAVDAETADAIRHGIQAADEGRLVSSEQVRERVAEWITRFSTQTPR